MDLHVKRFTVRYQGKDYGPDSVIYDVKIDLGKKLIADSNGTIAALPKREAAKQEPNAGKGKGDQDAIPANTGEGLPSLDPSQTVK
jgi:hypothetical protein